jgi:O-antigen ligase
MDSSEHTRRARHRRGSHPRTPQAYRICDWITEGGLYFTVLFAPWAFGTTERWSIWTLNVAGYILGLLLFSKWLIRWRTGYRPVRWGEAGSEPAHGAEVGTQNARRSRRISSSPATVALAALTVIMLANCFISAVNARSTFIYRQMAFEPHEYIAWLPHSYDRWATTQTFWMYLGLALTFWAARDWLLGKSGSERRDSTVANEKAGQGFSSGAHRAAMPARLRRLLWVLCLNGTALALESILQRLSGTDKLLWLVQPAINRYAELQFGPYAYRSNAAQYFNLLWPVCLGFWWTLRRDSKFASRASPRLGAGPHVVLLPCAVLMAAAPVISTSRGGALVAFGGILLAAVLLSFASRRSNWLARLGGVLSLAATIGLAAYLGWDKLEKRLTTIFSPDLSGRAEIYENAREMARDFPLFGTGPGTFPWVYHLYRAGPQTEWAAYAHNDWLETRVTLGWTGLVLVVAMLLIVLLRWFGSGGITAHWLLVSMIWLALGGCLFHARFDFPFQICSTLALFLLLGATLFCLSKKA